MGPDFPCSQIRLPKRRIFAFPECGKNPKRKIPPGSGKSLFSSEPQKQHFRGRGSRQIFPMETEQCSSAKAADPGAGIAPGNDKGKQPGTGIGQSGRLKQPILKPFGKIWQKAGLFHSHCPETGKKQMIQDCRIRNAVPKKGYLNLFAAAGRKRRKCRGPIPAEKSRTNSRCGGAFRIDEISVIISPAWDGNRLEDGAAFSDGAQIGNGKNIIGEGQQITCFRMNPCVDTISIGFPFARTG